MDKYKFPFIGAGKATYFDYAEVQVIFKEIPNRNQQKRIEVGIPFPINDFIIWEENAFSVGSEAEVGTKIATFYQTINGKNPENQKDYEDDGWFFASDSQIDEFNKNIVKWLNEINQISPILLAFRRNDPDSIDVRLSDWHKWSVKKLKLILPFFDNVVLQLDYKSIKSYVLRKILHSESEMVNEKYKKYLFLPKREEIKAFLIYPFRI